MIIRSFELKKINTALVLREVVTRSNEKYVR